MAKSAIVKADVESDNLEAHVALCHQRYENLERRLTTIEDKVEHIHTDPFDIGKTRTALDGRAIDLDIVMYGRLRELAELFKGQVD